MKPVAAWFVVMAAAALVLPAFRGEIDGSVRALAIAAFAVVAAGALAVGRQHAGTRREALVSSLPALGLLAAAAVVGFVLHRRAEDFRGEPIFLFFGIALLASWAGLVLVTALTSGAKWNRVGALVVTLAVSLLGLFLVTAQID